MGEDRSNKPQASRIRRRRRRGGTRNATSFLWYTRVNYDRHTARQLYRLFNVPVICRRWIDASLRLEITTNLLEFRIKPWNTCACPERLPWSTSGRGVGNAGSLADSTPCSNFSFLIFLGESLQGIVMIPSDGDIDWLEFRIKLWIFREDPLENDWEMIYLWLFDELPLISRERCGPLWWMKKNGVERRRNDSTNEWYYRSCYNDRRWKRIVNSRR